MINITRINHSAINTAGDVEQMKAFYCGHLGAKTVPRDIPPEYEDKIPGFWMQFENGQIHVIGNPASGGGRNPLDPHIAYYVSSLEDAERYLAENSIDFDKIGGFVFVSDPAGNIIELQQDPLL